MNTTTEIEIKVSGAKVTNAVVMRDGTCKITIEMVNEVSKLTKAESDDVFVQVEASKLSMNDEFMKYTPETDKERELKMLLEKAIKSGGLKDFKRPKYDPSFNKGGICYESGKAPAVGKSYFWWNLVAKEFKPNSRLGTRTEYVAFLGVLIKKLVESGLSVRKAWDAVCNDSRELGHYRDSENSKDEFESTGSREICGFYDLANCYKILAEDGKNDGFWIAGGVYYDDSYGRPLTVTEHACGMFDDNGSSVGWLVLDF